MAFLDEEGRLTLIDQQIAKVIGIRGKIQSVSFKWTDSEFFQMKIVHKYLFYNIEVITIFHFHQFNTVKLFNKIKTIVKNFGTV